MVLIQLRIILQRTMEQGRNPRPTIRQTTRIDLAREYSTHLFYHFFIAPLNFDTPLCTHNQHEKAIFYLQFATPISFCLSDRPVKKARHCRSALRRTFLRGRVAFCWSGLFVSVRFR